MCTLNWGKFIQRPVLSFPHTTITDCVLGLFFSSSFVISMHHLESERIWHSLLSSSWLWNFFHVMRRIPSIWPEDHFAQQARTLRFVPLLQEMTFFLLDVVDVDHHWFSAFSHHFFCCSNRLYMEATNFSSKSTIFHTVNVCECSKCSKCDNHYFLNMLLVITLVAQWLCWLRPKPLWRISAVPCIKKRLNHRMRK